MFCHANSKDHYTVNCFSDSFAAHWSAYLGHDIYLRFIAVFPCLLTLCRGSNRYGPRAHGEEVMSMYGNSRAQGFGSEVRVGLKKLLMMFFSCDSSQCTMC